MSTATLQHATAGMTGIDRATPQQRAPLPAPRPAEPVGSAPPRRAAPIGARVAVQGIHSPLPFFGDGGPAAQPQIVLPLSSAPARVHVTPAESDVSAVISRG